MKKVKNIIGRLISHNISLFGGKINLGINYQPNNYIKSGNRKWSMSNCGISLLVFGISVHFSDDGIHQIEFGTSLTNDYRADKIVVDFKGQEIELRWNGRDKSGNHEYCYKRLYDWAHYNEFGTRVKKA